VSELTKATLVGFEAQVAELWKNLEGLIKVASGGFGEISADSETKSADLGKVNRWI
jgi:hypothetical protein